MGHCPEEPRPQTLGCHRPRAGPCLLPSLRNRWIRTRPSGGCQGCPRGGLTFHGRSSVKISLRAMSTRFHATASFSWWSQFSWPKPSWLREAAGKSTGVGASLKLRLKPLPVGIPAHVYQNRGRGRSPTGPQALRVNSACSHQVSPPRQDTFKTSLPFSGRIRGSGLVTTPAHPSPCPVPTSRPSPLTLRVRWTRVPERQASAMNIPKVDHKAATFPLRP